MDHEASRFAGRDSSRHQAHALDSSGQRGYAVLILMALMSLGALYYVAHVGHTLAPRSSASRMSPATADALRQAKEALIGYAATYRDEHPLEAFGYLPLPDLGGHVDTSGTTIEGKAALGYSGNGTDKAIIGRLPWYTLHLPVLKDEYGECLWYAVSGTFKNNPKTDYMNWDTLGYLDVRSPDGATSLFAAGARPVAVIFSAGPPLPGQDRSDSTETDDNVTNCHGNYDVRNYLDPYSATADTSNVTNWITNDTTTNHHAADSVALAVKQLLGGPLPGVSADKTPKDRLILNDRAVFITSDDIFKAVKRRTDFDDFITNLTTAIANCITAQLNEGALPEPGENSYTNAGVTRGGIPTACSNISNDVQNWRDQFFYLKCDNNGTCLDGNIGPTVIHWQGALIFAGERGFKSDGTRQMANPAHRLEPAYADNYLESANLQTFQGHGKSLSGTLFFTLPTDGSRASTDVLTCLPRSSPNCV